MSKDKPKIGEGHFSAMWRLGMREARELGNPGGNMVQQSEYGLYGTKTPGEVEKARRGDERDHDEETKSGSMLDDKLQQAKDRESERDDKDRDDRDRGLERE